MIKALWFVKQSLVLDYKFFRNYNGNFFEKIKFILLKYYLIFKHFFVEFELGKTFCYFNNKKIYYDTKYGLAGYQRMFATHRSLLKIDNIVEPQVIFDVGANVGFFSMLCRTIYPESNIYAFEPINKTFDCLKLNFENDSRANVYNLAASNFNGKTKMNFDPKDPAISQISDNGNIDVDVVRLDDFISTKNIEHIDILKIDTETFENYVLMGCLECLAKVKYLFIEITIDDNNNYTISSLLKLLSTDNYDFQLIGFRNYADKGEGHIPVMDALLKNIKLR